MREFLILLVLVLSVFQVTATEDMAGEIEATTIISLSVDSVTIYPDGLATVKRTGSMEVTEGLHRFVLDLPKSANEESVRFTVTNATIVKIIYDDNPEYIINVSRAGLQEFELSYLMPHAGVWMPSYSLYLEEDFILVSAYAVVANEFGEDLENIRLKLVAGPPQLERIRAPAAPLYLAEYEAAEDTAMTVAPKMASLDLATGRLETLYIYELEGRKDLEMDKVIGLPLFEESSPIERIYAWNAYWQKEGPVTEVVKANNTMKDPWPAGSALLYRNGEYVSRIDVPYTPNGTEASIVIGSSADLTVSRKQTNYTVEEEIKDITGAANASGMVMVTTKTWTYRLKLKSNVDRNASIEVDDRRPLEAEMIFIEPAPSETTAIDLKWELEMGPRDETTIDYAYKIVTTEPLDGSK